MCRGPYLGSPPPFPSVEVVVKPQCLVCVSIMVLRRDAEVRRMFRVTPKHKDAFEDIAAEHLEALAAHACFETPELWPLVWQLLIDDLIQLIAILEGHLQ